MKTFICGGTADDCLVNTLKSLNRHGCLISSSETIRYFPYPVSICLTNPLARFSFLPEQDPRAGIILGLCALAGINADDLLAAFELTFKPFLPGPYLRGFSLESKPYHVDLKNAGTRMGTVDQLAEAVIFLKRHPEGSFTISLRDPKKETDQGSGVAVSVRFYSDAETRIAASVYVPELDAVKQLIRYIIPAFTFVQQVTAMLLGRDPGRFYVISDKIFYAESDGSRASLESSLPRIKGLDGFIYREGKGFDVRYLDMVVQHLMDFIRRIRRGDLLVENPFKNSGHLEVFRDYGEAFRYGEAVDRNMSWDAGETEIRHPQLAYYYDF